MPLKPSYICQLSLLSLSVCLSPHHQAWSAELSLTNTHTFSQQDLKLQHDSTAANPLIPSFQSDDLSPLLTPHNPENSHSVDPHLPRIATTELQKPRDTSLVPSLSHGHHKSGLAEPDTTAIEKIQSLPRPSIDRDETAHFSSASSLSLSENPTLLSNEVAQIPEGIPTEESAGRKPSIRTKPSTPDEVPLDLRQELLTPKTIYSPSTTILTPSAYGKSWRQASVGFGLQHRTRFTDLADGAFGVGFGLGDARKYVGLDVGLTLTDLDNFDRGIISFKLHRRLPDLFAVAVGVNDAISWGPGDVDGPSPYGVVSKTFILKENTKDLFSRVYVSVGAGTGRYRTENNVFTNDDTPGIFGSLALRVVDPMNVIAEWSGQDLSIGLSLRPFREIPIIITPAVTDITGTAGDGVRFILGVGYAINF